MGIWRRKKKELSPEVEEARREFLAARQARDKAMRDDRKVDAVAEVVEDLTSRNRDRLGPLITRALRRAR